jgi:hypothetical protein
MYTCYTGVLEMHDKKKIGTVDGQIKLGQK